MNINPLKLKRKLRLVREPKEPPTTLLLLNLEWLLLGFTGISALLMSQLVAEPRLVCITILSVTILALMRLRTPSQKMGKVFYSGLELLVLASPSLIDGGQPFFPLLGLVIVMRNCQRYEQLGRIAVSGLIFAVFVLTLLFHQESESEILAQSSEQFRRIILQSFDITVLMLKLNAALSFGLAVFSIMLLINALLEERQSRVKLVAALDQMRQYSLRIEDQSTLQERNRIAREIHDSLGHTLTAQSIQLDSALLLQSSNREEASIFLQEAKHLCKQALQEVRHSVGTLRTDQFLGKSLDQIATTLVHEFRITTAIEPTCMMSVTHPIPPDVVAASYRVLQAALTNIARHSAATTVILQLFTQDGILNLQVQDNGKGFDPSQNSTGFGLQGMKERVAALGGQFKLSSQFGAGCLISVKIPLVLRLLA
jgi:signal transduction histidine kinase